MTDNKCYFPMLIVLLTLWLSACNSDNKTIKIPDVSHITAEKVEIKRFDQQFFGIDTLHNMVTDFEQLKQNYPEFFPLYLFELQGIADIKQADTTIQQQLSKFINNPYMREVYEQVQNQYDDISDLEQHFSDAFRYLKYHLPNAPTPETFAYISPFQHQALTIGNNKLGVSLDMHLGADYKYYASAGHPQYLANTFTKENLLTNAFTAYAKALFPESKTNIRLIDKMIYNGKILYFVEQMLPKEAKNTIIGYLIGQQEWCVDNEKEIWKFWTARKLLYETKSSKVAKYTMPSPTSAGMPPESPGNIGSWTGWQIVKAYMRENPTTTIQALFAIDDGQQILKLSKYQP